MKYSVDHFEKANCIILGSNGGKLIITDSEYIFKWLFFITVRFPKDNTIVSRIPDYCFWKGIKFRSGRKNYNLYFRTKTADELFKLLKI